MKTQRRSDVVTRRRGEGVAGTTRVALEVGAGDAGREGEEGRKEEGAGRGEQGAGEEEVEEVMEGRGREVEGVKRVNKREERVQVP